MQVFLQIVGVVLVLLALADIFLTVLHPRAESSALSIPSARGVWYLFRTIAQGFRKKRDRILSYGGPTIIITIIGLWVTLLLLGFAFIVWPALGTEIQSSKGRTPTDFVTAVYYAGFSLATLGIGDLVPQTAPYRLLMVLKSILGFSVISLSLSYILAIYGTLTSRNTFALSLHHRTADTADSVELLARLSTGNNMSTLHQDIAEIARNLVSLLEAKNSYPVLLYFRYRQPYYALPRIAYLTLDVATLIKTALHKQEYHSIICSSGTAELWYGGKHLLEELCYTLLPKVPVKPQQYSEHLWREHYYQAIERLRAEGIKTVSDLEAGADAYIEMRYQWAPYVEQIMKYMAYEPRQIFSAHSDAAVDSAGV